MGIWIRSQNRQDLINAETIRYYNCYHGSVNAIIADEFFMGDYSSREKAMRVLDMIQDEIRKPYRTYSKGESSLGIITQALENYSDKIFQMPQDDEVEV